MPIMMRSAPDDYGALQIANAAEKVGAQVISITYDGQVSTFKFKPVARSCFIVWIRYADGVSPDDIDNAALVM
jgi:hypothetical protein